MKTCKYCETNYDEATNIDAMFPHDIELNSRFLFDLETCGVATIGILAYTTKLNVVVVIRDGFPNKRYVLGLYNIPNPQAGTILCPIPYVVSIIKAIEADQVIAIPDQTGRTIS